MSTKAPYKILNALRGCVVEHLFEISTPVCELPIIWSDHRDPADACDCDCADGGTGQGWIRYTRLAPKPVAAKLAHTRCGGGWVATVEVGIHRCAPAGVKNERPTPQEKELYAQDRIKDMRALLAAWECCDWFAEHDVTRQAVEVIPTGPQGGCGGVIATGQIELSG